MPEENQIPITASAPPPNPAAWLFELQEQVIYPFSLTPVPVAEENSAALAAAMDSTRLLAIFPQVPNRSELGNFPLTLSLRTFEFREQTRSAIGILARVSRSSPSRTARAKWCCGGSSAFSAASCESTARIW